MADQLYLSLWFPDFQLAALPAKLIAVMRQFATISGDSHVIASAAYPISFSEAPTYQRIFVNDARAETAPEATIENAVAEATEQLHHDTAYEFELRWKLWTPDSGFAGDSAVDSDARLDTMWRPEPTPVKVIGFGPEFDDNAFEQNGHIRVDFGLDYPWVLDDETSDSDAGEGGDAADHVKRQEQRSNVLTFPRASHSPSDSSSDSEAARYIQRNVEMLLAFTLSVEKNCGISSRLLWTESGEPLAEKLIARLQRLT